MTKKEKNKPEKNVLKEGDSSYGFVGNSETEKLKENLFRSDKEKFLLFKKSSGVMPC